MHAYSRVFTCVMYSSSFGVRRRAVRQCNKICTAYREERQKQSVGIVEEEEGKKKKKKQVKLISCDDSVQTVSAVFDHRMSPVSIYTDDLWTSTFACR